MIHFLPVYALLSLIPSPTPFWLHEGHRGPGILSHMHDIEGRKVVNVGTHWGSEQQEELRYQITYHMYPTSGCNCHMHSVECVVV